MRIKGSKDARPAVQPTVILFCELPQVCQNLDRAGPLPHLHHITVRASGVPTLHRVLTSSAVAAPSALLAVRAANLKRRARIIPPT